MRDRFGSLFNRMFRTTDSPSLSSPDLDDGDLARLLADMRTCLASSGVGMSSRRRLRDMVALHGCLSPLGRSRFAALFDRLEPPPGHGSDRYSMFEETELFGSPASKLAIMQSFEPPRRRLLALLAATPGGADMLAELKESADDALGREIERALAEEK